MSSSLDYTVHFKVESQSMGETARGREEWPRPTAPPLRASACREGLDVSNGDSERGSPPGWREQGRVTARRQDGDSERRLPRSTRLETAGASERGSPPGRSPPGGSLPDNSPPGGSPPGSPPGWSPPGCWPPAQCHLLDPGLSTTLPCSCVLFRLYIASALAGTCRTGTLAHWHLQLRYTLSSRSE